MDTLLPRALATIRAVQEERRVLSEQARKTLEVVVKERDALRAEVEPVKQSLRWALRMMSHSYIRTMGAVWLRGAEMLGAEAKWREAEALISEDSHERKD